MITRTHSKDGTVSSAVYSPCEAYRYALTRRWDDGGQRVLFVMLNPSKATELQNDPTVERCERRARTLGFGAFQVVNIFAWRDTDPFVMRKAAQPVGPQNDAILLAGAAWADQIIAARRGGGVPHLLPTVQDGLMGMKFIDACVRSSARNAAWVSV